MKNRKKTALLYASIIFTCLFIFLGAAKDVHAQEDIVTLTQNAGYQTSEAYRPKASIVIDADTGSILWADNADLQWNPASIAKLMSAYLVFDAMAQGKFTLDTAVVATESDQAISQIYELSNNTIVAGVSYPVRDLLYATLVQSSNVATVMLANLVTANDEAKFIHMMNDKAKELGMTNSTFYNSSGAESSAFNGYYTPKGIDANTDNITTARDLATLSYFLLKNYPDVLTYTSPTQVTIMANTPYAEILDNHNYSLPGLAYGYEGADGLKTGSSPTGGYNYAATAKRGDMRLIEVILGVGTWEDQQGELQRHAFGNTLFDQAFNTYEYKQLLTSGKQTINNQAIVLEQNFSGLLLKNTTPEFLLTDGLLTLNNGLTQVATTVPAPSVAYQVEKPIEEKKASTTKRLLVSNIWITLFAGLGSFLLGILLLLSGRKSFQKSATRRHKKRSILIPFGTVFCLIGVCLLVYVAIIHYVL